MKIREATLNDISLITQLIQDSFLDVAKRFHLTKENCPKHPSNCTGEWIDADFDKGKRYFILEDPNPVGCVAIEKAGEDLFYLERLAVLPQHRRQGYGLALTHHVFKQVKASSGHRISIGIIDEQTDLKNWYTKIGFHVTETKTYPHLPFTVTLMEISLDDP